MDFAIADLATSVTGFLIPYASMGAQEFVRSIGKDAYEKAKSLISILKIRWVNDEEATDALARFEEKPERYRPVLEDVLAEKLSQDEGLAAELLTLLNEIGPTLEVVQKMEEGQRVTGLVAQQMSWGRANIRQDITEGEDITGARIAHVGSF